MEVRYAPRHQDGAVLRPMILFITRKRVIGFRFGVEQHKEWTETRQGADVSLPVLWTYYFGGRLSILDHPVEPDMAARGFRLRTGWRISEV